MMPESRDAINVFVKRYFMGSLKHGESVRVLWFKKPPGSQSIPELEHIHVLVKGADDGIVDSWISAPANVPDL